MVSSFEKPNLPTSEETKNCIFIKILGKNKKSKKVHNKILKYVLFKLHYDQFELFQTYRN